MEKQCRMTSRPAASRASVAIVSSSAARVWMTSGLPSLVRDRDLGGERALLVGAGRVVAVVVQAGLADRPAVRVPRELAQLVGDGVV